MNDEQFTELAVEHILSGLTGANLIEYRHELARRGEAGQREVDRLKESVAGVALSAPSLTPPAGLREKLLKQVGAATDSTPADSAVHGDDVAPRDAAVPGASGTPGDSGTPESTAGLEDSVEPEAPLEPEHPVGPGDPVLPKRRRRQHSRQSRKSRSRGWLIAASVAALLAVGFGALNIRLQGQLRQARDELESARVELAIAEGLRARIDALQGDLVTVSSPETNTVTLSGTEEQPAGRARVFIDPLTGRALVFVYDLDVLGPDLVYQLWAIRGTTPVDAGVFTVDANGQGRLESQDVEALLGADALAVTVEPAPGQPSPTGAIVLSS